MALFLSLFDVGVLAFGVSLFCFVVVLQRKTCIFREDFERNVRHCDVVCFQMVMMR